MKKVSIQLIFFLLFNYTINAQIPFTLSNSIIFIPSGKSNLTTGENYYIDNSFDNQIAINIYYKSSTLDFKELSTYGLGSEYKVSDRFQLYLGFGYFGFDLMNEMNITSALSFNFDLLCIGLSAQYNRALIRDFSSEGIFSFDAFGMVSFDDISFGFLVNNINQAQYSDYKKTLHQRSIFTIGYDISEEISADIGTVIIINSKSSLLLSTKYQPIKEFAVNLKYLTNNQRIILGLLIIPSNWLKLNFFFTHQEIFGADYSLINQIEW